MNRRKTRGMKYDDGNCAAGSADWSGSRDAVTGAVFAAENNEVGEYLADIVISCIFSILIFSGIEALINLRGA